MEFRKKIGLLPKKPGVYLFKDSRGNIIYVGKAKSLRSRVSSYFSGKPSDPKTGRLIKKIEDVEYIVVDNEVEALVLEANLIREYSPRYNVNLKDGKRYPYLHITDEPFPRIEVVRRRGRDGMFFGPYTDAGSMRRTLAIIQENFRLRACRYDLPNRAPQRACLNHDIGRCDAPCQGGVTQSEYSERIEEAALLLKGRHRELVKRLTHRMNDAAADRDFELAAKLRDQISAIETIWQKQKIDIDLADRDIHAIAVGSNSSTAVTMQVREGRVIARQEFYIAVSPGTSKKEVMSGYLAQYYAENINPPKEILVSVLPDDADGVSRLVSERRGAKVGLRLPERGKKRKLVQLVERNAELLLSKLVLEKKKVHLPFAVIELEKELRLKKPPRSIEAIDISHLGGTAAVGSLVTFRDGKKYSRGYRRFRIKTAEPGDDYASVYEVVSRRIRRLKEENKGFPDLLLIDGGKGQLNAAERAVKECGADSKTELASIAKRFEEIFRPGFDKSFMLPKDSSALRLLMRIRDEAHRFALEYQRKRRTKAYRARELASVPGIGPKRQKKLLTAFDSLEDIAGSPPEKVAERAKLPVELAKKVVEFLSPYKTVVIIVAAGIFIFSGCTPSPRYLGRSKPVTAKPTERVEQPEETKDIGGVTTSGQISAAKNETVIAGEFNSDALIGAVNIYLGTPYRYGGTGLDGIDCSAFTQNVFKIAGVDLPRTSSEQYREGKPVSRPALGDMVFFRMSGRGVDHVGVALGDGRFAHASSSSGVTIDSLDDPNYRKRFLGARRVR